MKTWTFLMMMVTLSAGALMAQTSNTSSPCKHGKGYEKCLADQAAKKDATSTSSPSDHGTQAAANPTATPGNTRWSERRDPFVSALRVNPTDGGPGCSVGKRCLTADEIILRGVVITQDRGNLALVENSGGKSTVLFVNDQIFHGSVVKITNDSLVLRIIVTDEMGKKTTRDVVKRVTASPV